MAAQFPNGTVFAVAQTLSAPFAVTALSNGNPAVATLANPLLSGPMK